MIRLAVIVPDRHDSGSYWRSWWPLCEMKKQVPNLFLEEVTSITPWQAKMYDAAFFFRPFDPGCLQMIEMLKRAGTPVWADFDDLLTKVPNDNPSYPTYCQPPILDAIQKIIALCDHITVSTNKIKQEFESLNPNITVVPNGITECVWERRQKKTVGKKVISWRGGRAHQGDIYNYVGTLMKAYEKHPDFIWLLFGGENFWFWMRQLSAKRAKNFPLQSVLEYFECISQCQSLMHLVPLIDNDFNRAKSNIAWLEGTLSGACTIAPNWEEWSEDGIIRYDTDQPKELLKAIDAVIKEPDLALVSNFQSQKVIEEKYLLPTVNMKRVKMLTELLEGRKKDHKTKSVDSSPVLPNTDTTGQALTHA